MISVALISNLFGSVLFLVLTVLLLINWRGQLVGGLLILASLISMCWLCAITYNAAWGAIPLVWIKSLETLRTAAWLSFLYVILGHRPQINLSARFRIFLPLSILALTLGVLLVTVFVSEIGHVNLAPFQKVSVTYLGHLLMALLALMMIEQIYRYTLINARWTVKYLCLGVGGIFAYDFFLYSEALLFNRINPDIWFVRGVINGICVPLIAVAVSRNKQWKMELFVSRHVVYQSTALTVAGTYLLAMAVIGYYIKNFGGTWGEALQIIFVFIAIMLLLVLFSSEKLRTRLKIYLQDNFYRNKYDYRQEWLHITRILSDNRDDKRIYTTIVSTIAEIMKCPGGAIWLSEGNDNRFTRSESVKFHENIEPVMVFPDELSDEIVNRYPVINLDQFRNNPDDYDNLSLPESVSSSNGISLFMALINDDTMLGFILLTKPHVDTPLNREDVDLLKTISYQIAGYIALLNATERLAEARQFEVFNRLSAFVVHDIKNLVAQLSLINNNARKYRNEPEFIDDVFETIDNSVAKMKRLLANLQKGEILGAHSQQRIGVEDLVAEVIKLRSADSPVPVIENALPDLELKVEKDKLVSVLEHLVQNGQDATPPEGQVLIGVQSTAGEVVISIRDTGCGMDADFIRGNLFRPFYTTKGNAGMGIGAYESREVIRAMGGQLDISSTPGEGTTATILLPAEKFVVNGKPSEQID